MFSKMSGKGYIILNILRALNIISLIMVVIASWVMLVRTVQTSNVGTLTPDIQTFLLTWRIVLLLRWGFPLHYQYHWYFPYSFGAQPLQILFRSLLATTLSRVWFCLSRNFNAHPGFQHSGKFEQGRNERRELGLATLAHCYFLWRPHICDGGGEYHCRKYIQFFPGSY
jgi:hypothetical protein